jgi:dihydrodipicolinate synthase/N-acetylneuraminate lyase
VKFFVATLTPFDGHGRLDLPRLRDHIQWLTEFEVDGFIPTASTGEFLYLDRMERQSIIKTVIEAAPKHSVLPCTWDPSPAATAYLNHKAAELGAKGVILPPPLYYELNEESIESWYRHIARTAEIPLLGCHIPQHIPNGLTIPFYQRLRDEGVLSGMKDSSGDIYRLKRLAEADPTSVLAGGDALLGQVAEITKLGGFVSQLANVWPAFCKRVFEGEEHLQEALTSRIHRMGKAGGVPALKALANMGCRMPLSQPSGKLLTGLPPAEDASDR